MQLDDAFFDSLGQQLTDTQKDAIAANVYSELEERVGAQLESQVSDQQYEEFQTVVAKGNDLELDEWLARNAPGYEELVEQTLEQIKQEAKTDLHRLLTE